MCLLSALFNQASLKECFVTATHSCWTHAYEYVKGCVTCPTRCHLAAFSDKCSQINNQALSHFLSNSPWDHRKLLNWIQINGVRLIGKLGALIIDEWSNPKAGNRSVGVKRQYCGNLGKVENCQVGVYAAYVKKGFRILLGFRLFLPKSWIYDPIRCEKAGIPLNERVFRRKADLAYELIVQAVHSGIRFTHVCMDSFYGSHPWLLTKLEAMKITYVAGVKSNERVYLEKPEYSVPSRKGNRGRKPSQVVVTNTKPVKVEDIMKKVTNWRLIRIRMSSEGFLEIKCTVIKVWRIDKDIQRPLPVLLLIRKELDDSDIKYALCNDITIISWNRLASMHSERYWIERSFEDAIELAGMGDYQVRNWSAWHHHMALVLLAMFWITKEQSVLLESCSDMTVHDTVKVIQQKLPLKVQTALSVAKKIFENHRNRKASRRSKMKKKKLLLHDSG